MTARLFSSSVVHIDILEDDGVCETGATEWSTLLPVVLS